MQAALKNKRPAETKVVLFDGYCVLCDLIAGFIIRYDKKQVFKLASLQSEEGINLLKQYNLPTDDFDSFVYIKGSRSYTKSTGALEVFKDLGGIYSFLFPLIYLPVTLRDFVYNLIARYRFRLFGRLTDDSCELLPEERRYKGRT